MRTSDTEASASGPPQTVLVVEDEVLVRMVICAYLRECGYRVIEAASAREAMDLMANAAAEGVSVVLSDVEVPGDSDGFVLAQWIRQRRPQCEVILAGTATRAAAAGNLCEQGPMLAKPYEPKAVVDRIKLLLAKRRRSD
jgi:CheY-like chemotaxis protein